MIFNDNLDLCVYYSFENDKREEKKTFPKFIQNEILIAIWIKTKLETNINKKFNKKGFFICVKTNDTYEKICFGKPFDFNYFVENIKNKNIIFDSGMYRGNTRNYSHFRSNANLYKFHDDEIFCITLNCFIPNINTCNYIKSCICQSFTHSTTSTK